MATPEEQEARRQEQERNRRENLAQAPDNHLQCRELGHSWRINLRHVIADENNRPLYVKSNFVCSVCRTIREDEVSLKTFDLTRRKYTYAVGYQFHDSGWVKRTQVRREVFTRQYSDIELPKESN